MIPGFGRSEVVIIYPDIIDIDNGKSISAILHSYYFGNPNVFQTYSW